MVCIIIVGLRPFSVTYCALIFKGEIFNGFCRPEITQFTAQICSNALQFMKNFCA